MRRSGELVDRLLSALSGPVLYLLGRTAQEAAGASTSASASGTRDVGPVLGFSGT